MILKSFGSLSATSLGTGSFAASAASAPYFRLRPVAGCSTSPACARQASGATFQRLAAAAINRVRAIAPACRKGCQDAMIAVEPPVAWTPATSGLP